MNNILNMYIIKKISFFVIFLFIGLTFISLVYADQQTDAVLDLRVEGNKTLSSSAILAKVRVRIGDAVSQSMLNEDIKRLYATGYFETVRVKLEPYEYGKRVIFQVEEKPIIGKINIKGNSVINDRTILKEISSAEETFLNPRILHSDIAKVEKLYIDEGFPEVKVEYNIDIDSETNKAVINIIVTEGAKLRIKEIRIEGNQEFTDRQILKIIQTKRDTLFSSGIFKEDVLKEDVNRIESFYRTNGFLDARVSYNVFKTEKRDRLIININIDEGRKYTTGDIKISGYEEFSKDKIIERLDMKSGDIFTHQSFRNDIANIQSFYFEKGYIFANVRADTMLNPRTGDIDITYEIDEGILAYIDRINIEGNIKTKDIVIRRELRVYPGEPFDGDKLRRSKERLDRLGIFQTVNFDVQPTTAPNRRDLLVEVQEAKTGEFSFGAGYSSVDQAVGFIELRQNNFDYKNWPTFTGAGQRVSIRAEMGTVKEDYDLSFTEPWIFNRPVSFGFDVFQRSRFRERDVGYAYDQRNRGGNLRLGREFTEYISGNLVYRYENIKISDIADNVSDDLRDEKGKNTISSLRLGINRDTRDSIYSPTTGIYSYFSVETAGTFLGGDKEFMRYIAGSNWYFNYFQNHILELKLKTGLVDSYGSTDKVPIYERFFSGGANTIRGYRVRDVGPKDSGSGDPIGGKTMLVGNAEYSFPIVKNFRGALFFDAGNVWEKTGDFGRSYKTSVGTGIRIRTPIGPVRLDYGIPLDGDSSGRFHFSMGRMF